MRILLSPEDGKARNTCDGCKWYLGGGICQIEEAAECRDGGGFELYEEKEKTVC